MEYRISFFVWIHDLESGVKKKNDEQGQTEQDDDWNAFLLVFVSPVCIHLERILHTST